MVPSSPSPRSLGSTPPRVAVRGAEHWLEEILAHADHLLIAAIDARGRLVACNDRFRWEVERLYGDCLELGDHVGRAIAALPAARRRGLEIWHHALRVPHLVTVQRLGDPDGDHGIFEMTFARVLDDAGRALGTTLVARDVTAEVTCQEKLTHLSTELERRVIERALALRRSEEKLRLALEAGELGVWELDARVGAMWWDAHTHAVLGLDAGQRPGLDVLIATMVHDDHPRALTALARALSPRSQGQLELEFRITGRARGGDGGDDSEPRWVGVHGRVYRSTRNDARQVRLIGVIHDITARKRAETRLRDADARKSRFLAVLGHELRNPLAAIANGVELWHRLEPELPERLERVRDLVARQVRQVNRLVDDLLDVTRIARGKLGLECELVDLRVPVQAAAASVDELMRRHGHHLRVDLPDEPLVVDGDPTRLQQIAVNLLTNAARYTDDAGEVLLRVEANDGGVCICVEDNGMGMSPDDIAHIFDEFRQTSSPRQHRAGGLGLGLSLVKRLCELHGGYVTAASPGPGRGSTFTAWFPLAAAPDASDDSDTSDDSDDDDETSPDRHTGARRSGRRVPLSVLVVDDNVDLANSMADLLESSGHRPRAVHDGQAALEAVHKHVPDVVLLDLGLPDIDGAAVARAIRVLPALAHTRIVAMTGFVEQNNASAADPVGDVVDALIVKPVDLPRLLDLFEKLARADARPTPGGSGPS